MSFHKKPFSIFRLEKDDSFLDILKKTKNITQNDLIFNEYINHYTNLIQIPSFKIPSQNIYPKLRVSTINPLQKKIFDYASDEKNTKPKTHRELPRKSNGFLLNQSLIYNFNKEFKRRINKIKYNQKFYKSKSQKFIIQYNLQRKERNSLLADFLDKWKDSPELKFDESEIFNRNDFYDKLIESRFNCIISDSIENQTNGLESSFYDVNQNKIHLKLNSMKIKFTPIKENEKHYEKILFFPLAYMFLFYFNEIKYFKYILLAGIHFNEDFTNVQLDGKEIQSFVKNEENMNFLSFKKKDDRKNFPLKSEKPNFESLKTNNEMECYKNVRDERKYFTGKNSNLKFPKFYGFKEDEVKHINPPQTSKKTIKFNYENKSKQFIHNAYEFFWVTPKREFKVEITVPSISFFYSCENKTVTKFMDRELFLFLLNKHFQNWDFYIMNFLFSLKKFRLFIENISSKIKQKNRLILNKDTELYENAIELSEKSKKTFSYDNRSFLFFQTEHNRLNSIITLHSYSLKVDDNELNPKINWEFHFNFSQMKFLNTITQYENLETFMKKMLITNSNLGTLNLNFSIFEEFDVNNLIYNLKEDKEIEQREIKEDIHSSKKILLNGGVGGSLIPIEANQDRKGEMKIGLPHISIKRYSKMKIITKTKEQILSHDLIQQINKLKYSEWPGFIVKNKDECNFFQNDFKERRFLSNKDPFILKKVNNTNNNNCNNNINKIHFDLRKHSIYQKLKLKRASTMLLPLCKKENHKSPFHYFS